jgi:hypothetical protein
VLKVKNRSDADLQDRFNGVDFLFPKGESTVIDEEVARHIFGFGDENKIPYLTRLGWMRSNLEFEQGMKRLALFTFSDEQDIDPDEIQQQQEQGLAPLQSGAAEEAATDGEVESAVPIPPKGAGKKRSILEQIGGAVSRLAS